MKSEYSPNPKLQLLTPGPEAPQHREPQQRILPPCTSSHCSPDTFHTLKGEQPTPPNTSSKKRAPGNFQSWKPKLASDPSWRALAQQHAIASPSLERCMRFPELIIRTPTAKIHPCALIRWKKKIRTTLSTETFSNVKFEGELSVPQETRGQVHLLLGDCRKVNVCSRASYTDRGLGYIQSFFCNICSREFLLLLFCFRTCVVF